MGAKIKVGVVQAEPIWFDLQGSVKRVNELIEEAYNKGCELVGFPEVFIPGYPSWIWSNAADIDENVRYINNSLSCDSEEFQSIVDTVKKFPIHVVLGFSERDQSSLYISQTIIDKTGEIKLKRRKLKPTHVERVIWGDATASDLKSVVKLPFRDAGLVEVGCLSCWEHLQPLLQYNSAVQHEKIHIGSWPTINDEYNGIYGFTKEGYQNSARDYAQQTQSFYLFSSQLATQKLHDAVPNQKIVNFLSRGVAGGAVFAPSGDKVSEDMPDDFEGIVVCEIDMDAILRQKHLIDVVGHYSRPDLMSLSLNLSTNENVVNYK